MLVGQLGSWAIDDEDILSPLMRILSAVRLKSCFHLAKAWLDVPQHVFPPVPGLLVNPAPHQCTDVASASSSSSLRRQYLCCSISVRALASSALGSTPANALPLAADGPLATED